MSEPKISNYIIFSPTYSLFLNMNCFSPPFSAPFSAPFFAPSATPFSTCNYISVHVTLNTGENIDVDHIVLAVGLAPSTDLGDSAGLEVHPEMGNYYFSLCLSLSFFVNSSLSLNFFLMYLMLNSIISRWICGKLRVRGEK